jgi:quercetin 2,3-dioxygenase
MPISSQPILPHAKISPYRASRRAHFDEGWLVADRSFNFPDYYNQSFEHFGPIRVLNEDRVAPRTDPPRIHTATSRSSAASSVAS